MRTFRGLSYAEAPRFLGRDPAALDRFPEIAGDTGPIMVAASVTLPFKQGHWTEADYSPDFREFLDGLDRQPGLLGTHALSSVDEPGMLVILTWWKDKQALNGWFYSDVHQGYIHRVYGSRTPGAASPAPGVADPPGGRPRGGAEDRVQVGIDLCLPLPGGIHLGGRADAGGSLHGGQRGRPVAPRGRPVGPPACAPAPGRLE